MTITVELPDDLSTHENAGREALEALAIEGYRSGKLTHRQAAAILDLHWCDFDGLLKSRGVMEGAYDEEMLRRDIATSDALRARELLPS
jgi:predicted HTH domain antitoxin